MRTHILIDAANLFYGFDVEYGWKIDYKRLKKYLEKNDKEVYVLARSSKTAREVKRHLGSKFIEIRKLKNQIEFIDNK